MNKISIIGRAVRAPELRTTQAGLSTATLTVAVNRRYQKDQTDFFRVVAWRGLADNVGKYVQKGMQLAVSGEMQSRKYTGRDGTEREVWELIADEVEFLSRAQEKVQEQEKDSGLIPIDISDDELPF